MSRKKVSREKIETYNIIQKNKCIYKYLGLKIDEQFFNNLESIILFIGYSRSGHSLVGSLLDAHPEILVSHELHVVKHLMSGKSKDDILRSMAINSALFNKNGREYTGYDYSIKGQFQGKGQVALPGHGPEERPVVCARLPTSCPQMREISRIRSSGSSSSYPRDHR